MTIIDSAALHGITNRAQHIVGVLTEDIGATIEALSEGSEDYLVVADDVVTDRTADTCKAYFEFDSTVFEYQYNRNREHIHYLTQVKDWENKLQAATLVVLNNIQDIPAEDPTFVFNRELWEDHKEFTRIEYAIHDPEKDGVIGEGDLPVGFYLQVLSPVTICNLSHDDMVDILIIQQLLIYLVDQLIEKLVSENPVTLQHI